MDKKTFARCSAIWFVLLLFAVDGTSLIRAADHQLPAEESLAESLAEKPTDELAAGKPDPCPYPVTDHSPDWFVAEQAFSDETGLLDVKTERSCMNLAQAEEELWRACINKINPILDRWYGLGASQQVNLAPGYVREHLVHDNMIEFQKVGLEEPVDDVNEFFVAFGRFELDQDFRLYAKSRLQDARTRQRIVGAGLVGGTLLSVLAVALGYLKMETATRGFYSRRLQTVALISTGIIIALACFLLNRFML